jgi:hypothetical protein
MCEEFDDYTNLFNNIEDDGMYGEFYNLNLLNNGNLNKNFNIF